MSRYKNSLIGIVVAGALFSGAAHAGTVTPSLSGSVVVSDGLATWNLVNGDGSLNGTVVDNDDGTFTYEGMNNSANPTWSFAWDITVNPDPFINSALTVINKTNSTQHFNILLTLPVGSPFAPGQMSGNMSADFFDFNGNGVAPDGSVSLSNIDWFGRIDGADVFPLFAFDISCGPGAPGCFGSLGPVNDGPLLHASGVSSNIGIRLAFDLTAGDKATFNSYFEVVPVPVPAAVWLFGSGLLGLAALARRRKN